MASISHARKASATMVKDPPTRPIHTMATTIAESARMARRMERSLACWSGVIMVSCDDLAIALLTIAAGPG